MASATYGWRFTMAAASRRCTGASIRHAHATLSSIVSRHLSVASGTASPSASLRTRLAVPALPAECRVANLGQLVRCYSTPPGDGANDKSFSKAESAKSPDESAATHEGPDGKSKTGTGQAASEASSTQPKSGDAGTGQAAPGDSTSSTQPASGDAASNMSAAGEPSSDGMIHVGKGEKAPGGLAVHDDESEENLPPLAFEPGAAGVAQKGISAVVIAFGALAFGACAWGVSEALFPSASSTQVIFNEAFDQVRLDGDILYALGTPLKARSAELAHLMLHVGHQAYGADHGSDRGRRNAVDRWEVEEGGEDLSVIRFHVVGPNGAGLVLVQVPRKRRRGEFRYVIFEHKRKLHHVIDNRSAVAVAAAAAAAAEAATPAPVSQ